MTLYRRSHLASPQNSRIRTLYLTFLVVSAVSLIIMLSKTLPSSKIFDGQILDVRGCSQGEQRLDRLGNTREIYSSDDREDMTRGENVSMNVAGGEDTISNLPLCPDVPPDLGEKVPIDTKPIDYLTLTQEMGGLFQHGGLHRPSGCRSRERTAIIIPYRDRRKNLLILLHNLLPFLVRQQMDFRVFLVEQSEDYPFNRCLLFNVGYVESQRLGNFSCFIVHDTDLVPRDYRNLYRCDVKPRHFVIDRSDKPFHGLNYPSYIGGVLGVRRSHMEAINGCSNMYYGWGFEDDDLYIRFQTKDMVPERYRRQHLAEYTSLDHGMQPRNRHKHELLGTVFERMKTDGLSSLKYWVEDFQLRELYTWFLVQTPPTPTLYNDTQVKHKQVHKKH